MKARAVRTTLILILIATLHLIPAFGQIESPQPIPGLPPAQLDSLVAPVALYPDPLLSQVLVASTYPLEIVQAVQWLEQNPGLSPSGLQAAASQQNWDASVQSLILIPDALHLLADNIQWATDLGDSFISQQTDVMDAIQRLRSQAVASGALRSNEEELVTTTAEYGSTTAVEIEPPYPQVIYLPLYEPAAIWGVPVYPYPVIRHHGMPIVVQVGVISYAPCISVGYALDGWGGWSSWGWEPNWFGRTVVINNVFIQRFGPQHYRGNTSPAPVITAEKTVWLHDPGHRGNVPYVNSRVDMTSRRENRTFSPNGAQSTVRTLNSASTAPQISRPAPLPVPQPNPVPSQIRQPASGFVNGSQTAPPHVAPSAPAPAVHTAPPQASHPAPEHAHSEVQARSGGTKPH